MKSNVFRGLRLLGLALAFASWTALAAADENPGSARGRLSWSQNTGVTMQTSLGRVSLDFALKGHGPILRFPGKEGEIPFSWPKVEQPNERELLLRYRVTGPGENRISIVRRITMVQRNNEAELVEEFSLTPEKTINTDLEIERPFLLSAAVGTPRAVLPLYNGWARTFPLGGETLRGEWQLGNVMRDVPSHQLALPVVEVGQAKWLAAVCADPCFGSLFELSAHPGMITGAVRWRYAGAKVPLAAGEEQTRHFGLWLAAAEPNERFGRSLDAFFRLMLPDVPPGPKWLHEIALVGYDYLSDGGKGWEKDVKELARLLTPEERRRVALCFHGWYENIGGYGFDDVRKEMKQEWVAMGRTRKVRFTQEEVRRQLKLARDLGFRVLWYFGDGILQDSGAPCYRPEWDLVDGQGKGVVSGWTGPDTWGQTFARNPAHPQVYRWYQDYLAALLKAYGPVVDGFVWDETFYIRTAATTQTPQPAYCDRAMLALIKALTAQVRAANPQKVFLASDCLGGVGTNVPGYALVADGTYQDTACAPAAWSYGLFPAWRNVLWSCNWWSVTKFHNTRWGVEHYGAPVAISNGWEDDRGPSKWTPQDREKILALFRQRLAGKERVRCLMTDPAKDK